MTKAKNKSTTRTERKAEKPRVVSVRGELTVLDSTVAQVFGVETREVNQAVKRNLEKFRETHVFQLSTEEVAGLRSQGVIPKPGRGGRRSLPFVFTQKGVARLATILDSPQALEATDLIIDVFIDVQRQTADWNLSHDKATRRDIPTAELQMVASRSNPRATRKFQKKFMQALDTLLDVTIDTKGSRTVRDEIGDKGRAILDDLGEMLKTRGLKNEKVVADISLILEQAREVRERTNAGIRKSQAEEESLLLENLDKKIQIFMQIKKLADELEPSAMIDLLDGFTSDNLPLTEDGIMIEAKPDGSGKDRKDGS